MGLSVMTVVVLTLVFGGVPALGVKGVEVRELLYGVAGSDSYVESYRDDDLLLYGRLYEDEFVCQSVDRYDGVYEEYVDDILE